MLRGQGGLLGCWSGSVRGPSGNDAQAASTALPAPAAERPAPLALGRARRRRARAGISFEGKLQLVAFCVFEACVGLFWPSMMKMRSQHVPEETRSTIINFFRIPLNLFVYPSLPQPCSWGVSREHGQPRTQGTSPVNPSLSRLSSP